MNALAINFVLRRRLASPLGVLLLVVGVASVTAVALDYVQARDELDRVELRQARVKRPGAAPRPRPGTGTGTGAATAEPARNSATGTKAMETVTAQLGLPWDAMLRAIETHSDPAVALLGVEAQGQTRTIRISGEAKTMADVVAYVRRLRESPQLTSVFLNGHEEKQAAAVTVIRFTLDAKWSGPP